ncbi:EcsC family protein [Pseudomonas aeruginosa]|nr:EcsC family protein [Pseudomonas aeruginosa]
MSLSPADLKQLQAAKNLLENPGLTAQLTSLLGTPIEYGLKKLPRKVNEKLGSVIEGALLKVARSATATLQENASGQPANRLHTLGAAVSGGVGGFFGPLAMLVEVPVTTGIIFRSIADIARSEGESIRDMDTLMACIEVFAHGGKSASDDASESGYYAGRTARAQQGKAAADFLGKDAGSKKAAPMLLALVRKVAERLGVQYSEKLAAQIVPIVGALGGAAINTVFMNHFQAMARGHFVVRRLERHYGKDVVRDAYALLPRRG